MISGFATGSVVLVGAFAVIVGTLGITSPGRLQALVLPWASAAGLWSAAGLRLVFAAALWVAAPASQTPLAFQILAVVVLAAAILLPVLGLERFKRLLAWWLRQPRMLQRAWLMVAIAFGAYLLWSVLA